MDNSELAKRLRDALQRPIDYDPNGFTSKTCGLIADAATALELSRAPQPDTVTDKMAEAAHRAYERFNQPGDLKTARISDNHMRATLTAALATRSKA